VEESVAAVTGRRVDAGKLTEEYRRRPWRYALEVLLNSADEVSRCGELCPEMYGRSAMKRLLVYEGMGMALDRLRAARIEMGAITREPHARAMRQLESTGVDRFLSVLSPTPAGDRWEPSERYGECLGFLGYPPEECAFVSVELADLRRVTTNGCRGYFAGWVGEAPAGLQIIDRPGALEATLSADWPVR
jgi:phosphoglycolate phosphatase-like HAD superfamily hydrolase